jgi:protease-4
MTREQVDAVGQGRVFTGEQAAEKGLVDELGGFMAALEAAKNAVGIPKGEAVPLVFYPRPKPFYERLAELFGVEARVRLPHWLNTVRETILPFEFPEGSLLTLMPIRIDIR